MRTTRTIRRLCAAGLVSVAVATLASTLAFAGWPFELFAHFRWQLGGAALALLVVALVLRDRWLILASAVLALVQPLPWLANGARIGPTARAASPAAECTGPVFRAASLNLYFANRERGSVLSWLKTHPTDVVALQEVTGQWATTLATLGARYPYVRVLPRDDPYGIALLSRWPLHDAMAVDLAGDGLPSLVATVAWPGRDVHVVALHTRWPVTRKLQRARDRALTQAVAEVRNFDGSTVMLGDLNLTPYAPAYPRLLRESGLRDAFGARAWRPTWSTTFWPLALPLDHVLVSQDACVVTTGIGRDVGSDHRPVWVELRFAR